jgi:hypothetical protein
MVIMDKRKRIFILGNSLILNALGESLKRSDHFDLTSMEMPDDIRDLEPMKPDAIVFDLETPHKESIFSLSESCSKLLLVGVSPDTNIVKIWTGRQLQELSIQGLMAMIDEQLHFSLIGGGTV